jgi:uncharacterized protein (TIGR03382 family)
VLPLWTALLTAAHAIPPGPFVVAHRDVAFQDMDAGTVFARVHYPAIAPEVGADADPSGGPYPVAAFLHGYFGSAWMYQGAAEHLASLGLIVVNMDTQTGFILDIPSYAVEAKAALGWVESRSALPAHWLSGMADGGPFLAMGHSMGGATLAPLSAIEPRIDTLIGFMPYSSDAPGDYASMGSFAGDALYLAGSVDETSTPDLVRAWADRWRDTGHGLYLQVQDLGHQAVSDLDWGGEPLTDAAQRDIVLQLATDFLAAERFGEPDRMAGVWISPPHPVVERASHSLDLLTSAEPVTPTLARVAVAGPREAEIAVYAGRGPGTTVTEAHGPIGLRDAALIATLPAVDGLAAAELDLPEAIAGVAWLQAVAVDAQGERVGEPLDLFGVGDPGPVEPEPAEPEPEGTAPEGSEPTPTVEPPEDLGLAAEGGCGGCASSGPAPIAAWLAALTLTLARRRRS